jgi:hypothetical protein
VSIRRRQLIDLGEADPFTSNETGKVRRGSMGSEVTTAEDERRIRVMSSMKERDRSLLKLMQLLQKS